MDSNSSDIQTFFYFFSLSILQKHQSRRKRRWRMLRIRQFDIQRWRILSLSHTHTRLFMSEAVHFIASVSPVTTPTCDVIWPTEWGCLSHCLRLHADPEQSSVWKSETHALTWVCTLLYFDFVQRLSSWRLDTHQAGSVHCRWTPATKWTEDLFWYKCLAGREKPSLTMKLSVFSVQGDDKNTGNQTFFRISQICQD